MSRNSALQAIDCAVVGLGNPGPRYAGTRHNIGFLVVEQLALQQGVDWYTEASVLSFSRFRWRNRSVVLAKPQTYMNRSGLAIVHMIRQFGISADNLLVVHDDLDLPPGRMKLAPQGGTGGHRGIASIIEHLGHSDFPRIKVGIGRPKYDEPIEQFVLNAPYEEEQVLFTEAVLHAEDAVKVVLIEGLQVAMNRFNRRRPEHGSWPSDTNRDAQG